MSDKWDAIIIGSGIGGLTCGAFLAKAGMRVRILEQHSKIGGYAHSFMRNPFRFESGIHSVPLNPNGFIMFMLKRLGIEKCIEPVSHELMYSMQMGNETYTMPAGLDDIKAWMVSEFPHERENVASLLNDMDKLYDIIIGPLFLSQDKGNEKNRDFLKRYQSYSYKEYIASYINDKRLRDIFYCQWPFCGLSPGNASTPFFTLMYYVHAKEGSHYLKGGFESLAKALASVVTENGGEISVSSRVQKALVEKNCIKSIVLESGEEIEGRNFISNISPYLFHGQILDEKARNRLWLRRLHKLNPSFSSVAVYLGLDRDISPQLSPNILMWHRNNNFEEINDRVLKCETAPLDHMVFLKTPHASKYPTLFLMTYFKKSYCTAWKTRKDEIASQMLDIAESVAPGLRESIKCRVTASPLTFERYTGNTDGALYGFENTYDLYGEARIPITTYIPNLYQAGHWCKGGGVWNVMECGHSTSKAILRSLT